MQANGQKCVMVIEGGLPAGVASNTAAILGITLGKTLPEIVGPDVADAAGRVHVGITGAPIPILKGDRALLYELRERLCAEEFSDLLTVDFSDVARRRRPRKALPTAARRSAGRPKRSAASPAACRCCGDEKKKAPPFPARRERGRCA